MLKLKVLTLTKILKEIPLLIKEGFGVVGPTFFPSKKYEK